ncbi:MAG: DUF3047 domain-containing protein [Methylococcaceae bacterium]|nr:DUF3047 domain-containing protein [Methylococcaceae bacterium]
MKLFSLTLTFLSIIAFAVNAADIQIGHFSSGNLDQWKNKTFSGKTDYQIIQLNNTQVLKAESHSTASGLFKEQQIDLRKTPFLNWRWRIDNRLEKNNEQSKSGDDYSARVYVVINGGWAFWKTKAINYVWASNTVKGSSWPNAFTGKNAMMIAVRSSEDKTHTWYQEKRNIMQDLKQHFGEGIHTIDAVALMTDTDNAQGNAVAYYGDIYFSAH